MKTARIIEIPCLVEIEQTADSLHAHAITQGITMRPGDCMLVHGAPHHVAFGERITIPCRATITRAGWLRRIWTQATGFFELTELYEVGFAPKETP